MPMSAVVFDTKHTNYDMIIGLNVLRRLKFKINMANDTISWNDNTIPFRPLDYFASRTYASVDANVITSMYELDEYIDSLHSYHTDKLLKSAYDPTNLETMARDQKHLNASQQNDLLRVWQHFGVLLSGKLRKYPHQKVHIELKPGAVPKATRPYPVAKHNEAVF